MYRPGYTGIARTSLTRAAPPSSPPSSASFPARSKEAVVKILALVVVVLAFGLVLLARPYRVAPDASLFPAQYDWITGPARTGITFHSAKG